MASKAEPKLTGNNLIIVLILITFLVVGVSVVVGKSLVANIILHAKVLKAKQDADNHLTTDLKAAPNLVSAFASLGSDAGKIGDALPNKADLPGLLIVLENMTKDAGVLLKGVTPAAPAAGAAAVASTTQNSTDASQAPIPKTYDFQISVAGRYDTMLKLMDHLEKSARPMRITGSQISGSGSSLGGTISVETYYQDEAQLPFSTETIK